MTNNYNWPDPARPGVPMNTEKDGWHWLYHKDFGLECALWLSTASGWQMIGTTDFFEARNLVINSWCYISPCLTPAEFEARVAKARRAALEEAAERAKALTDSWRNQEQRGGVAYGETIIASIRALMEKKEVSLGQCPADITRLEAMFTSLKGKGNE